MKKLRNAVTARRVAQHAGVSQSAVSRTFTPGASVSESTRAKVLSACKELGYRPNALARSLITSRSRLIGVAMAYLDNQFYPELLQQLSNRLRQLSYEILLFTSGKERDADPAAEQVLQYQVDGLVLASTTLSSGLAATCSQANIPVVLLNRKTDDKSSYSVVSDNVSGARRLAGYLLAGGHRRFAYIAGLENSSTNRERRKGFTDRILEAGLPAPKVVDGNFSLAGAARAMRHLLSENERPDAVFCANDHMAFAAMDVARFEFGLSIPEDLSIVGFDNAGPARWPSYDLTTIEQPVGKMVEATVDILIGQIEGQSSVQREIVLDGDLIIGSSARRLNQRRQG